MVGDTFHICNRGISKGLIFQDTRDYCRFAESLYRFNNKGSAVRFQGTDILTDPPPRQKIVDILKWSLLPNHYHLLVQECVDGGAIDFTKRLGNGYTKYINTKQERSGYLFQNKAKIIRVEDQAHFLYLPFYVELNPLDIYDKKWRDLGLKDVVGAIDFLKKYPWSSYQSYFGQSAFEPIVNKNAFYESYDTTDKKHQKEIALFLKQDNHEIGPEIESLFTL